MQILKRLALWATLACPAFSFAAYDINLSGKVVDAAGNGIAGVEIVLKDTDSKTTTDASGAWSLQKNATALLSSAGMGSVLLPQEDVYSIAGRRLGGLRNQAQGVYVQKSVGSNLRVHTLAKVAGGKDSLIVSSGGSEVGRLELASLLQGKLDDMILLTVTPTFTQGSVTSALANMHRLLGQTVLVRYVYDETLWCPSVLTVGSTQMVVANKSQKEFSVLLQSPADAAINLSFLNKQVITFTGITDKTYGDVPFNVTAVASSGLPTTLVSRAEGVCRVTSYEKDRYTVTLVGAGSCVLEAQQAGDARYFAEKASKSFEVGRIHATIVFTSANPGAQSAKTGSGIEANFTATVTPDFGAVQFSSLTPDICEVTANGVTVSWTGDADSCRIAAWHANSLDSAVQSFRVDGALTDKRNQAVYRTVRVGDQTWMAENLNFDTLNTVGSWCNNGDATCGGYGRLYNWQTATAVCPAGWHLPSAAEWETLMDYAGGKTVAGGKLKATNHWNQDGSATDDYGFTAIPGGMYSTTYLMFGSRGSEGYWHSATESSPTENYQASIGYNGTSMEGGVRHPKTEGLSVRCMQTVLEFADFPDAMTYGDPAFTVQADVIAYVPKHAERTYASLTPEVCAVSDAQVTLTSVGTCTLQALLKIEGRVLYDLRQNFTVARKRLSVATVAGAVYTKVYDGTADASLVKNTHYQLVGVVGNDVVEAAVSATCDSPNVPDATTVTGSYSATLTGAQAGNYTLDAGQVIVNTKVIAKPLTLSAVSGVSVTKPYDGTDTLLSALVKNTHYTLDGVLGSDIVNLATPQELYNASTVSAAKHIALISDGKLTGAQALNYSLPSTSVSIPASITPQALAFAHTSQGPWNNKYHLTFTPDLSLSNVLQNAEHVTYGNATPELCAFDPTTGVVSFVKLTVGYAMGACRIRASVSDNYLAAELPLAMNGLITDSRDGKEYPITKIGTQVWMARNLNYSGDNDANGKATYSKGLCFGASEYTQDCSNDDVGRFYAWSEVLNGATPNNNNPSGIKGICPANWHVPSNAEWDVLANYVDALDQIADNVGAYLRKVNTETLAAISDPLGFNSLAAGQRNPDKDWFGGSAIYWSATQRGVNQGYARYIGASYSYSLQAYWSYNDIELFTLRCVQDDLK